MLTLKKKKSHIVNILFLFHFFMSLKSIGMSLKARLGEKDYFGRKLLDLSSHLPKVRETEEEGIFGTIESWNICHLVNRIW